MRISDWSSDVCSSDLDALGGIALRFISAVGGIEPDHLAFAAEIFERRVLPVDECDAAVAFARGARLLDQRLVAVEDSGLDHRIARPFVRIMFTRAEKRRGARRNAMNLKRPLGRD